MPVATSTALLVGGALAGAGASVYSANKAADAQQKAAAQAAQISKDSNAQIRSDLAPYREPGAAAFRNYNDAIGVNGAAARDASFSNFRADPGYQYALDQGLKATSGLAAARGGYMAGGTLKALQDRGQGMADQGYGSYLDRFLKSASIGENAATNTGNFGAQAARDQGGYATDAGAAKAGGYLSAAAGVNGAISNGLKLYGYGKGRGYYDGNRDPYASAGGSMGGR